MRARLTYGVLALGASGTGCSEVAEVLSLPPADPTPSDGGADAELPDVTLPDGSIAEVTLDAGSSHACATISGALYCWGQNQRGRLGVGDTVDRNAPARVGTGADWTSVTASEEHSCALDASGRLFCFGVNDHGQLGAPGVAEALAPREVTLPAAVRAVSAESNFTCAVDELSELYCWGDNFEGQLGQNDQFPGQDQDLPVRVEELDGVLLADAGQGHTCALRAPGSLWCWGRNSFSELGLGDGAPVQTRVPGRVGTSDAWVDVDAGQNHSCGVESNGVLSCWGDNQFGNLGTGDRDPRTVPTPIGTDNEWVQVSLDTFHSCAIDRAAELWCWGRNAEGQLGLGDTEDRLSPARVPGGGFSFVAVGRFFTCAIRLDGSIWCAGANESGQLGVGDSERRSSLTRVQAPVD